MSNQSGKSITQMQWIAMIVGILVGVAITTLPRELVTETGRDGWITIIAATLLILIYMSICMYYARLFPKMTLAESIKLVLGKWIGTLVMIVFVVYYLAVAGIVVRSSLEVSSVYLDITTPIWVIAITPTLVIAYMVKCGLGTVAKISEVIFMLTVPLIVMLVSPILQGEVIHMLPVFEQGFTEPFLALPTAYFAFSTIELVVLVFYPYLENKDAPYRVTYLGIIIVGIIYTAIFFTSLFVMGVEQVEMFYWPFVEVLKIIGLPVLERVDTFFLYFWSAQITVGAGILTFGSVFSLTSVTKKDYDNIWIAICIIVVFLFVIYPENITELEQITSIVSLWGGLFAIILPIMLVVIAKLRGLPGELDK
ncbi:endospore germination permease [Proteinivorax hydrogeniformans]|uniref:Endospore germination permease n=1 Tax=Proteinivorax hydrogeniformans TaxID=1826727 RepID=A0AAU8HUR5_9FIRM